MALHDTPLKDTVESKKEEIYYKQLQKEDKTGHKWTETDALQSKKADQNITA